MSASAAVTLLLIPAFVVTAVAVSLVRARLRALEAACAGARIDLARMDEASRASDRSRRQLLVDVSHELRTPLTAMRGYLETLRMTGLHLDDITRTRYFQTVERETVRLDQIVEDLLDLARLESGVGVLNTRMFAVERVFQHVMLRHERETRVRQVEVDVWVDADADQVVADPDRIEQVVENLFANALIYTPFGGRVELRAECDGDAIVLSVIDSGPGIDAGAIPFVFDRFQKPDPARGRQATGSGLGLPIAKAIVERHHGSIRVTSEPGRTAFTIVLPYQSAEPRHHSTSTNL
jgi:two-component system OmpR family sensor kinase